MDVFFFQLPTLSDGTCPKCVPFEGVASFLDLAGFTKLTERLALLPDGAERLAKVINKLMTTLLDTLQTGDTIKFSGDAILVLYEVGPAKAWSLSRAKSEERGRGRRVGARLFVSKKNNNQRRGEMLE